MRTSRRTALPRPPRAALGGHRVRRPARAPARPRAGPALPCQRARGQSGSCRAAAWPGPGPAGRRAAASPPPAARQPGTAGLRSAPPRPRRAAAGHARPPPRTAPPRGTRTPPWRRTRRAPEPARQLAPAAPPPTHPGQPPPSPDATPPDPAHFRRPPRPAPDESGAAATMGCRGRRSNGSADAGTPPASRSRPGRPDQPTPARPDRSRAPRPHAAIGPARPLARPRPPPAAAAPRSAAGSPGG